MSEEEDYLALMSDLVKKQMVMLGPTVAVTKARKVVALTVSDDGQVMAITGEQKAALAKLTGEYMSLSGAIASATLNTLLEKYPNIKEQHTLS